MRSRSVDAGQVKRYPCRVAPRFTNARIGVRNSHCGDVQTNRHRLLSLEKFISIVLCGLQRRRKTHLVNNEWREGSELSGFDSRLVK